MNRQERLAMGRACTFVLLLTLWMNPVWAGCSRPISVPVSPYGYSVIVKDGQISGIIPELLATLSARTGCKFALSEVPRKRAEMMFEQGQSDMLTSAVRTESRDHDGVFITMIRARPTLISLAAERAPVTSIKDLIARPELRVVLVRGFDYGPAYRDLEHTLSAQKRLLLVRDPHEAARMLQANIADMTILPTIAAFGEIQNDAKLHDMLARLHVESLDELSWIDGGIYLSRRALPPADRALLEQALGKMAKSDWMWAAYARKYPAAIMHESLRRP
ncbi:MAG: substrate-binding periplasmic protein [Massilia sp.]